MMHQRSLSMLLVLLLTQALTFGQAGPAKNQASSQPAANNVVPPKDYQSKHFLVHTDLPEDEAQALLERLEATLEIISKYWGRKPRGTIECYVVKNMASWRESDFPHPFARTLIRGVGGGTFASIERGERTVRRKALVYASARQGVAEHEAVHAYCSQNFLELGPDWYREGMAQMAYFDSRRDDKAGVRCDRAVVEFLRKAPAKSIEDIVKGARLTSGLQDSLQLPELTSSVAQDSPRRVQDWIEKHGDSVAQAKDSYHAGWALCHLMSQNPNYSARFRALGLGYLNRQPQPFWRMFGGVKHELGFEHRLFLEHVDVGYRVDLCRWDWNAKFQQFEKPQHEISAKVEANRGYQASGILVSAGTQYTFRSEGEWKTSAQRPAADADGERGGRGRLVGVVFADYTLSKPIRLGVRGSFTAERDGRLYLRCRDAWNRLGDNKGRVTVHIRPMVDPSAAN